jgi:predicted ATPase/class 3 adenylate cyclase
VAAAQPRMSKQPWQTLAVPSVPSGTVTFLLTDVEGSTDLWSTDSTRMGPAIARHYAILDEVISSHGGARPVEQGEGDSIVAAFTRPSAAVAAAIDAQRRLVAELDWLPVRIAVHTGEAILRGGGNYVGPSIITCARIRACAHGRQILVSDATAALVGGTFALLDLGAVRLKGILASERVWQVTSPGLPVEFPALRGLAAAPHNLPVAPTSLVGRVQELTDVRAAVKANRLITLTGAGGCGKTRLALAVATETAGGYAGGSWWIELATTSTDDQVANAVAAALRIPLVAGADQVGQVTNHLRQVGPAMLVLDNAEHVIDAVAHLVDAIVDNCPHVTVVVTSREPLGVPSETVWRTPSLTASEAATLFGIRARHALTDLALDDELVAAICQRLDGIPLAIELAAARARSLPLDRIASELSNVFRVLTGGARTAVARQQTLLASIAWSHDLLNPVEQAVLRRLSVLQAPFLLETAEQIAADGELVADVEVLDVVAHLVDKSLVQFDPATSRYRLLETVRQYGAERLGVHAETASTRNRHAAFYGRYARQVGGRLRGMVVPDDLWLDLPDVFAALRWAYEASPVDAYRICAMNRMARLGIGYFDELTEQLDWLVARDGHDAPGDWAAAMVQLSQEAMTLLGRLHLIGDLPSYESSIDPDDDESRFWSLYADGFSALVTGDTERLEVAVRDAEGRHYATGAIASASFLAQIAAWTGNLDLAEKALARIGRYLRDLDQPFTCDTTFSGHNATITVATSRGRLAQARSYVQRGLPNNAFILFVSAASMALLGFVTADEGIHEIARHWVDRPAPPIQHGAAAFVAMARALNTGEPVDPSGVRAWYDDLVHAAPTSVFQFAAPLAATYLAAGDLGNARAVAADLWTSAAAMGDPPMHVATCQQLTAMIAHAQADRAATAAAALRLIGRAVTEGYVLLQIDGLELLALSATLSAETNATILAAARAARDDIGYLGRWPNLGTEVPAATDIAQRDHPAAYEFGTGLTLDDACSLALTQSGRRPSGPAASTT